MSIKQPPAHWRIGLMIALLLVGASVAMSQATKELRIVFIAYQNPDRLVEDLRPVVQYLEKSLGMRVKQFVSTNYAGIVEALRNETADVGFMGPLQYVIAHDKAGAKAILGEVYGDSSTYVSKIFVRKDSGISTLEDLRGKTIAFVDPISSSGYLYPLTIFRDQGLLKGRPEDFFKKAYFAGGDEQAIRAVYNKFVDAAGIGEFAYSLLRGEERGEVISIAHSRPIPSHCVVVRNGLDAETTRKVREAFLALNKGPDKRLLKNLYNVDGYIKVDHETYRDVQNIAKEYGFVDP